MPIKDNTNAVLAEANRLIKKKLLIASLLVERTAKMPGYCPRKTGTSARSITHEMAPDGKSVKVGSNVEYFPYHEMGTSKMPAHASLRRSLETNMKKIKRLFGAR
jgi:HK97 gp10 family phage protein